MNAWLWIMPAGSAAVFALYGLYCSRNSRLSFLRHRAWLTALFSFVFSVLFGTVLARVGYALLMQELDFEYDGIAALEQLLEFDYEHVSFLFGAIGVFLGTLLANRLFRKGSVLSGMDAFAPFGALLAALFRFGELCFDSWNIGDVLPKESPLAFFPFALKTTADGGFEQWHWAVCILSAAVALIWAVIAFARLCGRGRPGFCLTLTLFFLALPQIFCESLRKDGHMVWLFVHAEELLCALVLTAVLLFWILGSSGSRLPFLRRWTPLFVLVVCIGLLIAAEFAIDGKYFSLPVNVCYIIMCGILTVLGAAGVVAARHWNAGKE